MLNAQINTWIISDSCSGVLVNLAVNIPCTAVHSGFLPISISSIELSTFQVFQKILILDNFSLSTFRASAFQSLGWEIYILTGANGVSAAKNLGIDKLHGDVTHFAFQDADDFSHPDRFSATLDHMEKNESDVTGTQAIIYSIAKDLISLNWLYSHPRRPLQHNALCETTLQGQVSFIYSSAIFRRASIPKGIRFADGMARGEDFLYFSELINHGLKFSNIPKNLYAYQHSFFDNYKKFKFDNNIRGISSLILLRYLRNCVFRIYSARLKNVERAEWLKIFRDIINNIYDEI